MKKFVILVLLLGLSFNSFANDVAAELSLETTDLPSIELVEPIVPIVEPIEDGSTIPVDISDPEIAVKALPSEDDLRCLQQNIYFEARNQGQRGMKAVAAVTMNRVDDPRFPKTVCGVVTAKAKGVCQFSWVCDKRTASRPKPKKGADLDAWEEAGKIARMAFDGTIGNLVGNATHFHTTGVRPSWASKIQRIIQIGSHVFYYERRRN